MALDEDPSGLEIVLQYGTNTMPFNSAQEYDLAYMYNDIIGSGDHDRKEFEGYGAPEIDNLTGGSGQLGGYLDVSFTVIPNKLDTIIYVQIAEADGNEIPDDPDDLNWSISSYSNTYSTTTNVTTSIDVKTNTDYWVRVRYSNQFTRVDDIWHPSELGAGPYRSSDEAPDPLLLSNLTPVYTDGTTSWRYYWEYPDSSGNFQVRVTKDAGSTWESVNAENLTYEGSDIWWANFTPTEIIDNGTLIQFKIRRANTTEPWRYTDDLVVGDEDTSNLSQPDVSTRSAQNVGETSARIRMYIHSFNNIAGQEYNYYWRYREGSSGSWTTVRWSSTANNEADTKHHDLTGLDDNTYYEYQAFAVNTLGGSTQSGNVQSFTTDEIPLSPPENFSVSADGVGGFNLGWSTPPSGEPGSYRIDYRVDGGNWNVMESSYSGSATDYSTGDICHIASDGQQVDFRVRSNKDGSTSDWTPTKGDTQSGCGFGFE